MGFGSLIEKMRLDKASRFHFSESDRRGIKRLSCGWDTPAQLMVLTIEPAFLKKVGQAWVNPDQIELQSCIKNN
jgi:hypothetical protein